MSAKKKPVPSANLATQWLQGHKPAPLTPAQEAAAILGRLGGSAGTEAQNRARAQNAKKGGWPKGRKRGPRNKSTHQPSPPPQ